MMGAAPSKRKRGRKKGKAEIPDFTLDKRCGHPSLDLHSLSRSQLNRLSAEVDRYASLSSVMSLPARERLSDAHSTNSLNLHRLQRPRHCSVKGSFSAENLQLDAHPELSRLQNEQNARVESMELRMNRIRLSAMQEAERRKYAQLYPARPDEDARAKKQKLQEAAEALRREKQRRLACRSDESDTGEIIPVTILSKESRSSATQSRSSATERRSSVERRDSSDAQTLVPRLNGRNSFQLDSLNFGDPVTWLLLPFLVPVLVIMYCIHSLHARHARQQPHKKN